MGIRGTGEGRKEKRNDSATVWAIQKRSAKTAREDCPGEAISEAFVIAVLPRAPPSGTGDDKGNFWTGKRKKPLSGGFPFVWYLDEEINGFYHLPRTGRRMMRHL
jgi:hypothetical protein